jgi:hypothetical protein
MDAFARRISELLRTLQALLEYLKESFESSPNVISRSVFIVLGKSYFLTVPMQRSVWDLSQIIWVAIHVVQYIQSTVQES